MAHIRWDIVKSKTTFSQNVESLFKEIFINKRRHFDELTLCGWKPIRELYEERENPLGGWSNRLNFLAKNKIIENTAHDGVMILETPKGIIVKITLPNIIKDSIHIEVTGKVLILSGEQYNGESPLADPTIPQGNGIKKFRRSVVLPQNAGPNDIRAKLVGDTLKINIAKRK